jgi:hypothetical protein
VTQTRRVKNPREAAAYTFGYNHSLFAQRVHDILSVLKHVQTREPRPRRVLLAGLNGAGHWVAAARAQAGKAVDAAAIDTAGFRFGKVLNLHDVDFLPGGAKYGDLPGLLALGAPGRLWLGGEGPQAPDLARTAYALAGAEKSLTLFAGDSKQKAAAAVNWLLKAGLE